MNHGPKRSFSPEQEFFLVLVRLRLGLLEEDLAVRAGISQTIMSRIIITWLNFLHSRFRSIPIWPSRSSVDRNMPTAFKEMYPSTRVIIDCTEIFLETPSSFRSQSATYSNYKHHNTAKGLCLEEIWLLHAKRGTRARRQSVDYWDQCRVDKNAK
jgi:hypothetical protein